MNMQNKKDVKKPWVGKMMMMVHPSFLVAEADSSGLFVVVLQRDARTRMAPLL